MVEYLVIDLDLARRVGADQISDGTRILCEAHKPVRYPPFASGSQLSSVYFRITARGAHPHTRAPSLERLLARADGPTEAVDWRAEAYRLIAPEGAFVPAVATAALAPSASRTPGSWVCLATPVHLLAGMTSIGMASDGLLEIEPSEADALAADFNRVFAGGGVSLERGRGALLLCRFAERLRVTTCAPEEAAGHDLWGYLPRGEDAPRLRSLASEIEMWLFDHPVNRRRNEMQQPGINALWLWGEGAADAEPPRLSGWTAGDDPLFGSFAPKSRYPGASTSGVVTVPDWPGSPAWQDIEEHWLAPALADLRAGRLSSIELSARRRRMQLRARSLRRFWRRPRPWWEILIDGD
jgi:hypothetical protein